MCTPFGARASTLEVTQWQISRRCHPILVAFVSELTKESIHLPLGCLQGGERWESISHTGRPSNKRGC